MALNGRRSGPAPRLVAAAGAAAAVLFIALFRLRRLGPLDFWAWLAANIILLVFLSFTLDRGYVRRLRKDIRTGFLRKVALGTASAAALYAVFAVGRAIALRVFPFAAAGIADVYALRSGAPLLRVVLLIGLVVGPGEELFWHGFFQEHAARTTGRAPAFVMTALLYASVHLAAGNAMLVIAAAVCGLFWGWLYLRFRSPFLNVVSHTFWDLLVFVTFPF